jgi:phosphoribosyl-dephospho-CoA transferase
MKQSRQYKFTCPTCGGHQFTVAFNKLYCITGDCHYTQQQLAKPADTSIVPGPESWAYTDLPVRLLRQESSIVEMTYFLGRIWSEDG